MTQIAVITGTTHGIGKVTARELARAGYAVVMLNRDVATAARARDEIGRGVPGAELVVEHCDLASLASVREAAAAVGRVAPSISLLVNNAGIASAVRRMSVDGFELNFATNYLGPFLLTELLRARMASGARIVEVASRAHLRGALDLDAVTDPKARYRAVAAYAQSKLANVLHTFALARRLESRGVTANCLHPGVVATNLLPRWLRVIKPLISRPIFDDERGARTTLYLALSAQVAGVSGQYFDEHSRPGTVSAIAGDIGLQERLWAASERWAGLADRGGAGSALTGRGAA